MLSTLADIGCFIERYTSRRTPSDGYYYQTECDGLTFMRADAPAGPLYSLYAASICVTLQGAKRVMVGETAFNYEAGECFVAGLTVPTAGRIVRALPDKPYCGLKLALDFSLLMEMSDKAVPPTRDETEAGLFVWQPGNHVIEALARVVELTEMPEIIPALRSTRLRELYYWLLNGPNESAFTRLVLPEGRVRQVAQVVHAMTRAFPASVRVDDLAATVGMSPSSFHAHFKAVIGMTPSQYYKRLRLLEARSLMTGAEAVTAQDVAYRVGYESASQFSREYKRAFGTPPSRDRDRSTLEARA